MPFSFIIAVLGHIVVSLLLKWSWLVLLFFLGFHLLILGFVFLYFLSPCYPLGPFYLLFGEGLKGLLPLDFGLPALPLLVLRHINNYNIKARHMSRSSRQIAIPKELPRDPSSLSTYTHRRNGSI